jgi:hypothetical protein
MQWRLSSRVAILSLLIICTVFYIWEKKYNIKPSQFDSSTEIALPTRRVAWITASKVDKKCSNEYFSYFSAALMSWKMHNQHILYPVHVFLGTSTSVPEGEWLEKNGGISIYLPELSFQKSLDVYFSKDSCEIGTFVRLDSDIIVQRLITMNIHIDSKWALYTDCDIIFMRPIAYTEITDLMPKDAIFGESTEHIFDGNAENAGVLLFNIGLYNKIKSKLMQFGLEHKYKFLNGGLDQGWINDFHHTLPHIVFRLPNEWNWKIYWGKPPSHPILIHFHGPKPLREPHCIIPRVNCTLPSNHPYSPLVYFSRQADGGAYATIIYDLFAHYLLKSKLNDMV